MHEERAERRWLKNWENGKLRDSKFMVVQPTPVSKFMSVSSPPFASSSTSSVSASRRSSPSNLKSPNYPPSLNSLAEYEQRGFSRAITKPRRIRHGVMLNLRPNVTDVIVRGGEWLGVIEGFKTYGHASVVSYFRDL